MKTRTALISEGARSGRGIFLWATALAVATGVVALDGHPAILLILLGFSVAILFVLKVVREPMILVGAMLLAVILIPPFYTGALGETPIYVSTLLIPIGFVVVLVRLPDFNPRLDPIALGLLVFLLGTGLSLPFGWWFSGTGVGNQSFFRWLMLGQCGLVYCLIRGGARQHGTQLERAMMTILFVAAVLTAAYGIVDFVWPIPIPHPAADQFIWLRTSIMRRAQGVFYEAGNFANLCAFFLVIAASALLSKRERDIGIPLPMLLISAGILSVAVFVSFTRSTWISVLVAIIAFICVAGGVRWHRVALSCVVLGAPVLLLPFYSQSLWNYLVSARIGNLAQILTDPNLASSGRFDTWSSVISLLASHPRYLLFGIGYKTLPFTRLFHDPIITDNGFLNLLIECGVVGLGAFLFFSAGVFKTFLQTAREETGGAAFWGAVLFSFWCGEWTQMMAVDAYTYWRNMTVFVAVMGFVMNRLDRVNAHAISGRV
jgi:O-Antigen ligase